MKLARPFRRAAFVAALGILTAGLGHPSGATMQQAAERPLTVDFYALGADGASIADLRPEEVSIKIAGRARTIRTLRLVKQGDLPPADPLAARPAAAPLPFGTNGIAEAGRSFVVVIDDESFRPGRERPIRSALNAFLGALTPRDRVSLWTVPHGGIKVNLTTNHDRVSEAMQVIIGHGNEGESGSEAACRTRTSLEALEHMLSTMAGGEGPTTVVFFTSSMLGPRRDNSMALAPGMCELTAETFQRVGRMAASARAHFFVVQPEDLVGQGTPATENIAGVGFLGNTSPLEGIENLAGVTGGTRLSLTRGGDNTLIGVARATASYYSAVVEGTGADVEGPLGLDVKVSRNGVDVRSRSLLFVRKPAGATAQPMTPAEMVKVGTAFADLPMRVSGFASLNSGNGEMRVISAAEPVEANVKFTAMSAALFDSDGRLAGQYNASGPELATLPSLAAMVVPAGTYRLRVAAVDANGRSGAVDTEVVAEVVTAGSLKLSSLVLGLSREGKFQPRLQFSNEPAATVYLDIFGGKPGAAVGAIIEVAQTLNGPPLAVNRLSIEPTGDAMRFTATGAIPLGALPPGDYVARAIVGIEGEAYGQVIRVFRKVGQ